METLEDVLSLENDEGEESAQHHLKESREGKRDCISEL